MNLGGPYDRLFTELNSAHLWLHFKPGRVGLADIQRIETLPDVAASTGRRYSYVTQIRYQDERLAVSLSVEPLEQPNLKEGYILQ